MNLFQKPKLELYVFQQYFTPSTLPLKQDESKTNLPPKHTHHMLNSSFPYMFQIVHPNVRQIPLHTTATSNEIHVSGCITIQTQTL